MDGLGPSNGRDRRRTRSFADRPAPRRGYAYPRAEHRQPWRGQARRDNRQAPYVIGFILVVLALAGFLYAGLNWASGPGRAAALVNPRTPTPTAVPVVAAAEPEPTPTSVPEQVYIVKAGDNPATIARQFSVKTEDLMSLNNIEDPQKLQIGQTLRIPPPAPAR
jgi:nucleoid-associated protein YgaU